MSECQKCSEVNKRILKWMDHVGFSPVKYQRYDKLIAFVRFLANPIYRNVDVYDIQDRAVALLKEIGDSDE